MWAMACDVGAKKWSVLAFLCVYVLVCGGWWNVVDGGMLCDVYGMGMMGWTECGGE